MSSLERKMTQVALLLKKSTLPSIRPNNKLIPTKLPPLVPVHISEVCIGTELENSTDHEIFYCYKCFQGSAGPATWAHEEKNFCSWECQLDHQTEIAKIKQRRSELMLLNVEAEEEAESHASSSPCISPLHELTILRIK